MRNITIITIIIFIIIIRTPPALAVDDIGVSKIHPASPFYFLKAVREDIELKLAQTTRVKYLRQIEFATRRLREAKALISLNEDLIPPTLERYVSHINTMPDKDLEDEEIIARIKESLVIHLEVLQQIYNQSSNPRAKMFIRSAMHRIIQRADVPNLAKAPICNFFAQEASSSALNQTEQYVLKIRTQDCFKSL